jgi:serine protease AprX
MGTNHRFEGTRGSALWGRGSKSTRRRAIFATLTAVLALCVGVDTSSAGGGQGQSGQQSGGQGQSGQQNGGSGLGRIHAVVPPSLLGAAIANPGQSFHVILQGEAGFRSEELAAAVTRGSSAPTADTTRRGHVRSRFKVIRGIAATLSGEDVLKLARNKDVSSIVPDSPVGTSGWQASVRAPALWSHDALPCASDPLTGLQLDPLCSPLAAYLAPPAPAIAVVDSGIDATKAADFGARVIARADFVGDGLTGDPEGHGTMVAGVAAGASVPETGGGVAQSAPLVDVRVANGIGLAYTSDVISGLDWVLANRAQYGIGVVNLSLTGTIETSFRFDPLDQAVEKLWLNGITVVAAIGNHGTDTAPVPLGSPGNDPFVISVGALDMNATDDPTDDFRAPWSAYGYTADGFLKPELSAPGRHMVMPVPDGSYIPVQVPDRVVAPGYMWMSGTSFSAPVAAGAAAQLLALHPSWTPDEVKGALMAGATRLPLDGVGIGEVDAAASAAIAAPPNPNENLAAFVSVDPTTGLKVFSADTWATALATSANWTSANWTSANWTSANWTRANWTSANWTSANWTSANWTSANWTSANWVR